MKLLKVLLVCVLTAAVIIGIIVFGFGGLDGLFNRDNEPPAAEDSGSQEYERPVTLPETIEPEYEQPVTLPETIDPEYEAPVTLPETIDPEYELPVTLPETIDP